MNFKEIALLVITGFIAIFIGNFVTDLVPSIHPWADVAIESGIFAGLVLFVWRKVKRFA